MDVREKNFERLKPFLAALLALVVIAGAIYVALEWTSRAPISDAEYRYEVLASLYDESSESIPLSVKLDILNQLGAGAQNANATSASAATK